MNKPVIIPSKTNNKNMERYLHKKLSGAEEGGGSSEAIKFTEQELTGEQKSQARQNIGAGTYSKPDSGIPATDLAEGIIPTIVTTQPQNGFIPNILYVLGELTGNTTFSLATPEDSNIANHYYWTFETGSTAPTITWPSGITWVGGAAPTINSNKHYEISVLNGIGVFMEV